MKIFMNHKAFVITGLCALPVITWALLAWEPFDRLLARFFPEMFTDGIGRVVGFVPYTPFDALAATIVLTVYAALPVALILLVRGVVQSVRQNGTEKTARTVEKGAEATAVGFVTVLPALWMGVLGVAGFAARSMENSAEQEDRDEENPLFGLPEIKLDEYDWGDRR